MSLLRTLFKRRTRDGKTWGQLLHHLGEALVALIKAEALGIQAELRYGVAVFWKLLFMAIMSAILAGLAGGAVLVAALVGLRYLIGSWWAAALAMGALLGVASLWAALVARKLKDELESPVHTVHRRVGEHLDWWREELLAGSSARARNEAFPVEYEDERRAVSTPVDRGDDAF